MGVISVALFWLTDLNFGIYYWPTLFDWKGILWMITKHLAEHETSHHVYYLSFGYSVNVVVIFIQLSEV